MAIKKTLVTQITSIEAAGQMQPRKAACSVKPQRTRRKRPAPETIQGTPITPEITVEIPPEIAPPVSISKQQHLIALLRRSQGATIAEISDVTGWQAHSIRGAISGTIKKKLGLAVLTETRPERGRVYRIANEG